MARYWIESHPTLNGVAGQGYCAIVQVECADELSENDRRFVERELPIVMSDDADDAESELEALLDDRIVARLVALPKTISLEGE